MALVVGPMEPATQRIRPSFASSASAALRATREAAALISSALCPSPNSASTTGVPPKVSVSVTSAPAAR
jgi:hypothetical protein